MDAPVPWYSSVTFLTQATVVVSLLGAVAVVWVTLRVGLLRRRLVYGLKALPGDLEFDPHGKIPGDRHVVTVELLSRSRRDIPSDAYNDHEPLRLDIGSYILKILQIISKPETLPVPRIAVRGSSLNIGPSLIGKRHDITISVLVDGSEPSLNHISPLIDVEIRNRSDERRATYWFVLASIAILAAVVVAAFVILMLGPPAIDRFTTVLEILFAPIVTLVGVAVAYYYRNTS
jgi:hypothetical protein